MTLTPCPECGQFVRTGTCNCPFCGVKVANCARNRSAAALLLGLGVACSEGEKGGSDSSTTDATSDSSTTDSSSTDYSTQVDYGASYYSFSSPTTGGTGNTGGTGGTTSN
jgi:hypothetical protein